MFFGLVCYMYNWLIGVQIVDVYVFLCDFYCKVCVQCFGVCFFGGLVFGIGVSYIFVVFCFVLFKFGEDMVFKVVVKVVQCFLNVFDIGQISVDVQDYKVIFLLFIGVCNGLDKLF